MGPGENEIRALGGSSRAPEGTVCVWGGGSDWIIREEGAIPCYSEGNHKA